MGQYKVVNIPRVVNIEVVNKGSFTVQIVAAINTLSSLFKVRYTPNKHAAIVV